MTQLVVRNLDADVKSKLRRRARRHGRSTEAEVREILRNAVSIEDRPRQPLGSRLAARFGRVGLTQAIPELRGQPARPADFKS
jgi:plasmid stability protein